MLSAKCVEVAGNIDIGRIGRLRIGYYCAYPNEKCGHGIWVSSDGTNWRNPDEGKTTPYGGWPAPAVRLISISCRLKRNPLFDRPIIIELV